MAKKKDNTFLWIAALGVGGYLLYKHQQAAAAAPVITTSPAVTQPNAVLALPPSKTINTNLPASSTGVTNAPTSNKLVTTNLTPAPVTKTGQPVLAPGQTLALAPNGSVIVSENGSPLVFSAWQPNIASIMQAQQKTALMSGAYMDEGECL